MNIKTYYFFCFFLFSFAYLSFGATYYVNASGNNNNNGLSVNSPFQTLQYAASQTQPGDIVLVMNGTYTNSSSNSNVLNLFNSGTPTNYITFKNYPGHNPLIKLNSNNWGGIIIQGADYIVIDGFKIVGNNDNITLSYALSQQNNLNNPSTSGNGIGIVRNWNNNAEKPHHIIIKNCNVSKCGGAGIYAYRGDYITIEDNIVNECGWYSPYGNSGISLFQCWNSDNSTDIKNVVQRNICFNNENFIPFHSEGAITDGNGIIIDDSRNTQNNSTQGIYLGGFLITNNLCFDNGGRGINIYLSDNVHVTNNTLYLNCRSVGNGDLMVNRSNNSIIANNISLPRSLIRPVHVVNSTNIQVLNNLWGSNFNLANPVGTNTISADPQFILPSTDYNLANFRVQPSSPAINAGVLLYAPPIDILGNPRNNTPDIGCYEFNSLNLQDYSSSQISMYPNPVKDLLYINTNKSYISKVLIFNQFGQQVLNDLNLDQNKDNQFSISVLHLRKGIYFIQFIFEDGSNLTRKFIKNEG